MEVLEAIQKRRTVRIPFKEESIPDGAIKTLIEVSKISPSGDPISWRLVRADDDAKSKLARIVKEDFGDYFQKDSRRFKLVFSGYPKWLRFSDAAQDGIRLAGFPEVARHFYRVALGRRFGPLFGKIGILNAEINLYCRNIIANRALFGVFLDRRASSAAVAPILNAGSMLQNLRLAATSLGLCYQDLGWITATKTASDKARELLGMPDSFVAINFFRIGYAATMHTQNKKSDFRRDLKDIVHVEKFGCRDFQGDRAGKTGVQVLEAMKERGAKKNLRHVSKEDLSYILEAARWAPTGFNVQPFEFIVAEREGAAAIFVLESRERRDPDPGPCEALARGGVLQNMRLAVTALGLEFEMKKPSVSEEQAHRNNHHIPPNYAILAEVGIGRNTCRP